MKTLTLILLTLCFNLNAFAARSVTLGWDPNPETNVVAYRVYFTSVRGTFPSYAPAQTNIVNIEGVPTVRHTVSDLSEDLTYWFAVAAVDQNGIEGPLSDIVTLTPVLRKPSRVRILNSTNTTSVVVEW